MDTEILYGMLLVMGGLGCLLITFYFYIQREILKVEAKLEELRREIVE